jgi:NADPH:quinone reductase-like Zn-dependent oxidoreductase
MSATEDKYAMTDQQQTVYRLKGDGKSKRTLVAQQEPIADVDRHEVLVKIKGVALNFRDVSIKKGVYVWDAMKDVIPCSDACGEVVKIGADVSEYKIGDRVIGTFLQNTMYGVPKVDRSLGASLEGVLLQYRVFPEYGLVKIPKESKLTDTQAASLVCAGNTAWNALYGNVPLKPGQTVLMLGTGGVSILALQIARAAGAKTIITSSSDEKLKFVKETFGADYGINYKSNPDWEKKVLEYTGGIGVDYVIENGGSGTIEKSLQSSGPGGIVALIGWLSTAGSEQTPEQRPEVAGLVHGRGLILRGIRLGSRQQQEELVQFASAKNLPVHVEKEFNFSDEGVNGAFDYLESASHIGKVCIKLA